MYGRPEKGGGQGLDVGGTEPGQLARLRGCLCPAVDVCKLMVRCLELNGAVYLHLC